MRRFHASRIHYEHAIAVGNYDKGFMHFFAAAKRGTLLARATGQWKHGKACNTMVELSQNKAICTSDVFSAMFILGSDNVSLNRKKYGSRGYRSISKRALNHASA